MKRIFIKIILLSALTITPSRALVSNNPRSLQAEGLSIPLLHQAPEDQLRLRHVPADHLSDDQQVNPLAEERKFNPGLGHLNDASIAAKIELIDQLLLKEASPHSWPRYTLQSIGTLIHTFLAASATTGVFMYTSGDTLGIPPRSNAAIGMILWLVLSRAPGIANQFWSIFESDPWSKSELVYQRNWYHRVALAAAGILCGLNTSPWTYQMLWIESDFLYIFGIPAAPSYSLMNGQMGYQLAAEQIDEYFCNDVYPKHKIYTRTKRQKLKLSLKEAKQVIGAVNEEGVNTIFRTLTIKRHSINNPDENEEILQSIFQAGRAEEKLEEPSIDEESADENYEVEERITTSPDDDDISRSAMGMLFAKHENIMPVTSESQDLAYQNAKLSTERAYDYPKLRASLDRLTEFVSAFDAVAHGFVLYTILHFLPPGVAFTGCAIGSAGRWLIHYSPRCQTMHTIIIDGLIKRSVLGLLDCPTVTVVSLSSIVNGLLLTTIPFVLGRQALKDYPSDVQMLLLGSSVVANTLDFSRRMIQENITIAAKEPSFRLRKSPCAFVDNWCRKISGCFRSELTQKKLFINSYSIKAQRLVEQGTESLVSNLGYYFMNEF